MLAAIERVLLGVGAAAVLALGAMITTNVVGRALFGVSVPDAVTMVRELMVAAIVLPLGAATAARSHVAVTILTDRLPTRTQSWLIVMGSLIGVLALLPLLAAGWLEFQRNWASGGFFPGDLGLPRWPGRALFVLGLAACVLRLVWLVWADGRRAARGEPVATEGGHAP